MKLTYVNGMPTSFNNQHQQKLFTTQTCLPVLPQSTINFFVGGFGWEPLLSPHEESLHGEEGGAEALPEQHRPGGHRSRGPGQHGGAGHPAPGEQPARVPRRGHLQVPEEPQETLPPPQQTQKPGMFKMCI